MAETTYFVGDKRRMVFHAEDCSELGEIEKGGVIGFVSRGQAIAYGMTACGACAAPK